MKTIELEKNKVRVNMYFDPDDWSRLEQLAQDMSKEAGRSISKGTLARIAIRDLIKKLSQ